MEILNWIYQAFIHLLVFGALGALIGDYATPVFSPRSKESLVRGILMGWCTMVGILLSNSTSDFVTKVAAVFMTLMTIQIICSLVRIHHLNMDSATEEDEWEEFESGSAKLEIESKYTRRTAILRGEVAYRSRENKFSDN